MESRVGGKEKKSLTGLTAGGFINKPGFYLGCGLEVVMGQV